MNLKSTLILAALAVAGSSAAYDFNQDATASATRIDSAGALPVIVASGLRPTSISIDPTQGANTMVCGTWVDNSGTHNKTFLLEVDLTFAQIDAIENNPNWNIEDVEAYFKNGQKRFGVLAYSTVDQPVETKYFHGLTSTELQQLYSSWKGRITDLDVEQVLNTNYYTGVLRKNTGNNATGWYWHTTIAFNDIAPFLSAKNARVIDICQRKDGTYSVAYDTKPATYRYVSARSFDGIKKAASYYGYRIENINRTLSNGQNLYTGIIVNTKNALTKEIGNLLRSTCDGDVGAYLKQVDGDVLCDLQENELFYPASTMKVYMHAVAIWTTATNQLNTRLVPVWANHTSNNHQGQTPAMTVLPSVVNPMMVNSSNQMANACLDFWGMENIESINRGNFGVSFKTQLRSKLGLGGPYNLDSFTETTLTDLGALYENVNKKFSAAKRIFFRDNMLNKTSSGGYTAIAQQERNKLGLTGTEFNQWFASFEWMGKAGTIPTPDGTTSGYASVAGWMRLPYKGRAGVTMKDFVYGIYKDLNTVNTLPIWDASEELLRDEINKSLATFKS